MKSVLAATSATLSEAAVTAPRLAPIRNSWNPMVWIAMAAYRSLGATTPIEVVFARAPRLILPHLLLMVASEYFLSLDRRLRALARVHGSRVNNCMFCDDLETRLAIGHNAISREDADALPRHASSERFTPREKAVLAYVEELNTTKTASEASFAELRRHLSEREIVELTWLNAVGNYLNLQAKPLALAPAGTCELPRKNAGGR